MVQLQLHSQTGTKMLWFKRCCLPFLFGIGLILWSFAIPLLLSYTHPPLKQWLPLLQHSILFHWFYALALFGLLPWLCALRQLSDEVGRKRDFYNQAAELRASREPRPETMSLDEPRPETMSLWEAWGLELSAPSLLTITAQAIGWVYLTLMLWLLPCGPGQPELTEAIVGAGASILMSVVVFLLGLMRDKEPFAVPHHQLFLQYTYALPCVVFALSAMLMLFLFPSAWVVQVYTPLLVVANGIIVLRLLHLLNRIPLQKSFSDKLSRWSIYGW